MNNIKGLYELLKEGKATEQDPAYHPEGNVFVHSLQAFWNALLDGGDKDMVVAALFHDIGKVGSDYRKQHKHARVSEARVQGILNEKQTWLIAQHMRINDYLQGRMTNRRKRAELSSHRWFKDLCFLNKCDQNARVKKDTHYMEYFVERVIYGGL